MPDDCPVLGKIALGVGRRLGAAGPRGRRTSAPAPWRGGLAGQICSCAEAGRGQDSSQALQQWIFYTMSSTHFPEMGANQEKKEMKENGLWETPGLLGKATPRSTSLHQEALGICLRDVMKVPHDPHSDTGILHRGKQPKIRSTEQSFKPALALC